jgi:hypothetical protein
MKRSQIVKAVQEVLQEMSTTGAMDGGMGSPKTPNAFAKPGQGKNVATKTAEKLGYKTVERPKRPSHTKMFDYLDENK